MIQFKAPDPSPEDFAALAQALHDDAAPARSQLSSPAPAPELKNISHVHEAVMNWMIANPSLPLRACADHFGYTQSWLSTMIHSNLFQARLKEKQEQVFSGVARSINDKLMAGADIGVEKLVQHLEKSEDPKFIKDTTQLMLEKLGFGAQTRVAGAGQVNAGPVQNNFYMASPQDLEAARGRITGGVLPSPVSAAGEATLLEPKAPE